MTRIALLLIAILSAAMASASAQEESDQLVESINALLAHASTKAIPDADRIELAQLRFDDGPRGSEGSRDTNEKFAIPGTNLAFPIIAKKELRGKACARLIHAWRRTSISTEGGAFCHVPTYGIGIYQGERLLLATTVSRKCKNFYLPQIDSKTRLPVSRMTGFGDGERALLSLLASYFRKH